MAENLKGGDVAGGGCIWKVVVWVVFLGAVGAFFGVLGWFLKMGE